MIAIRTRARWSRGASRGVRGARGFTLLEVLLALVLLAFVMLGVWGALRGASRLTQSADAIMTQSEAVRTVQQFLRRYLAGAMPQPFVPADGGAPRMFRGTATSMEFVAALPMQSGHAGLYIQALSLDTHAGDTALELDYRPYPGGPADAQPVHHVLLRHLAGGSFEYLGTATYGAAPVWSDDWRAAQGLPLAVRIRLQPAWATRVLAPTLVIPLRAGDGFGIGAGTVP
ncbi:MAG TPA: prepilin-type N-terminal cleavage/methylation domain-containing protein [Rhodanobacteraceae bacterium]|nr:prepilin-type N-terminal cleavage/methylation domain-containing protein [Rhodanobacteraceae bacterium]